MPDASVVVVTYNALPWIEQLPRERPRRGGRRRRQRLHATARADVVRELLPEARVIEQENLGLAAGWNRGHRGARRAATS